MGEPLNSIDRLREVSRQFPIGDRNTDPLHEAVIYLRDLVAQHPSFGRLPTWWEVWWEVVNIDGFTTGSDQSATLCLDLDDGTTIRLDVSRYPTID